MRYPLLFALLPVLAACGGASGASGASSATGECSTPPPAEGMACSTTEGPQACAVPSCAPAVGEDEVRCESGTWARHVRVSCDFDAGTTFPCPSSRPKPEDRCALLGQVCSYAGCAAESDFYRCVAGTWSVVESHACASSGR